MKFMTSQMVYLLHEEGNKRNLVLLFRFFAALIALVVAYSVVFHYIMIREDRSYSWITGLYWTLTVMSTLGFGDITFESDLGRLFSMLVLMSGIVFLLILLPFTFIQFFYAPWLEARTAARTPREVPPDTRGHVILTHPDPVSYALIRKLEQFHYEYLMLVPDPHEASKLADQGTRVIVGDIDDPATYQRVRADQAALVVTTQSDEINTNVAFTVRETAPNVPIIATCNSAHSVDILDRAGATRILQLGEMMGKALARCTVGGDAVTHVVGNVDELLIAEANATRTPLAGKSIREARLTELGVSVLGIWDRGKFTPATADSVISPHAILVLAGSAQHFFSYDERYIIYNMSGKPAVVLGGGRVGRATSRALDTRGIRSCIVEQVVGRVPESMECVTGNAADLEILKKAGLMDAPTVLITTHNDSLNIYLTIYCRRLRPDIQIISRASLERNTKTLHRAGADFVFSYASMGATSMFNTMKRSHIVTITEGLEVFRTEVPSTLGGKTILESGVRETTGCTIVAVRGESQLEINPKADRVLEAGRELILVGDVESEQRFLDRFDEVH
jgi:Trk K+ transport system NAD-binding subunit